jgi:putative lipoprotein
MEVAVLSKFVELILFGMTPLIVGLAVTPAISASTQSARSIFDTVWIAEDIDGHGVIDDAQSTFKISGDGKAEGRGACNNYFSQAKLNGANIEMGAIGATFMMCPPSVMDQEKRFFAALSNARTFHFDNTGKLYFADGDGRAVLRFARSG